MASLSKPESEPEPLPASPSPKPRASGSQTMTLIRRFEERAGEMYARAKIGGFLHLSIGEEATIVGSTRALRETDYLVSTYRSHGYALARGTPPEKVMAELFGRVDGCCGGHGGSMHMFDLSRRFMGGYGIVGGNLPIATGIGSRERLHEDRRRDPVHVRRRRVQPGHVRRNAEPGRAVAAAGGVRGDQQPVRHGHIAGAPLGRDRPAAQGRVLGVPGMRCDGMDVADTHAVIAEAVDRVREDRRPVLVEAVTYRFRGHSMADPEEYRTKEEVAHWRERDPIPAFGELLEREGILDAEAREEIDRSGDRACGRGGGVRGGSRRSPQPESLYEDVYVLGERSRGDYRR